ncbi:protein of unknown function [Mesotoga infera]|uniref:Uncharacterized protein n=1 Tax=Mesotoga infera TaxID=1236046 RepID=A0A7Z7LHH4_9BACT|nr:protein of unknown function [Mesotoga infera]
MEFNKLRKMELHARNVLMILAQRYQERLLSRTRLLLV